MPIGKKASSYRRTGVSTGCHCSIILSVCLSVCLPLCLCICQYVCITFVVYTDCESCTKPISTNAGSMEAGEHELTRETCFIARRLEFVAVDGLPRISWCVLGAVDFRICVPICFSPNAHGLLQV